MAEAELKAELMGRKTTCLDHPQEVWHKSGERELAMVGGDLCMSVYSTHPGKSAAAYKAVTWAISSVFLGPWT